MIWTESMLPAPNRPSINLSGAGRAAFEVLFHEENLQEEVKGLEGYFNLWNEKKAKKSRKIVFQN